MKALIIKIRLNNKEKQHRGITVYCSQLLPEDLHVRKVADHDKNHGAIEEKQRTSVDDSILLCNTISAIFHQTQL